MALSQIDSARRERNRQREREIKARRAEQEVKQRRRETAAKAAARVKEQSARRPGVAKERLLGLVQEVGGVMEAERQWNIKHATMRGWQTGSRPGGAHLTTIAEHTGVSVDWLLGFSDVKMRPDRPVSTSAEVRRMLSAMLEARGIPEGVIANKLPRGKNLTEYLTTLLARRMMNSQQRNTTAARRATQDAIHTLVDNGGLADEDELKLRRLLDNPSAAAIITEMKSFPKHIQSVLGECALVEISHLERHNFDDDDLSVDD